MSTPTLREAAQALLPCPFCGSDGQTLKHDSDYWVECDGCHVATLQFTSESAAVSQWNRRAALTQAAGAGAAEPVARVIFTGRKKPDVEWLTDEVRRDTLLYTGPPAQQLQQAVAPAVYRAINLLLAHIGKEGSVAADHQLVCDTMTALKAVDGGVYVESLGTPPCSA